MTEFAILALAVAAGMFYKDTQQLRSEIEGQQQIIENLTLSVVRLQTGTVINLPTGPPDDQSHGSYL